MDQIIVSVTGVSGVGKTTFSHEISTFLDATLVDLTSRVRASGDDLAFDESRDSILVEPSELLADIGPFKDPITILDGLFSHLMGPTHTIVLECDPLTLYKRLMERGYSKKKAMENITAQYLGTIFQESMDGCDNVLGLDSTESTDLDAAIKWMETGGIVPSGMDWTEGFMELLTKA